MTASLSELSAVVAGPVLEQLRPHPRSRRAGTAGLPPDVRAKLADLRRRHDPDGLFS